MLGISTRDQIEKSEKRQEKYGETFKRDCGYKLDFQSGNPGLPLVTLFG